MNLISKWIGSEIVQGLGLKISSLKIVQKKLPGCNFNIFCSHFSAAGKKMVAMLLVLSPCGIIPIIHKSWKAVKHHTHTHSEDQARRYSVICIFQLISVIKLFLFYSSKFVWAISLVQTFPGAGIFHNINVTIISVHLYWLFIFLTKYDLLWSCRVAMSDL